MTLWFLRDSERLERERAGIDALSRDAEWLIGAHWGLDGGIFVDAVIRAHGHDYEVRVSYPALFPDAPIVVRPKNMDRRISTHQYGGPDGPLCLEWGPDNWHPEITAVHMLESAYRLFHTENPLGQNRPVIPVVAASRHRLTMGQELRSEWARWYHSPALMQFLAAQPNNSIGSFKFSFRKAGDTRIGLVHEVNAPDGTEWRDGELPTNMPGAEPDDYHVGIWFKSGIDKALIGQPTKFEQLKAVLAEVGGDRFLATDGSSPVKGFDRGITGVLIFDSAADMHLFVIVSADDAIPCAPFKSDVTSAANRAPESGELNGKRIGIVGLGSAGSKIAVSLARMGASDFYVVDHDVLLPENLRRHALDWQSVGQHKANALELAIARISPHSKVELCRLDIAGQESNALVGGALDKLAQCDLIIDATANPRVFNLLAAVARNALRPMIWLELFGGGIGGLVARSRPGIDPTAQEMRGAYLQYCTENPAPMVHQRAINYETESETGEVMVASDAEIAIVAHHAARFAPDCFVSPGQSKYPHSMYLIGLAKAWVFDAPFVNIPISMESFAATGWVKDGEKAISPDNAQFILDLLQKPNDATAHTA
jgi:hypothetical protein